MPIKFNTSSVPNTYKVYANGTRLGYIKANGTIVYHAQVPVKIVNNSGTTITVSSSANNVNQSISSGSTFSSNFFYDSNFTLSASELKYELGRDYNGSNIYFPTWYGDVPKNVFYTTNASYNETFNMSMNGLTLTLNKGDQITKVTKSTSCNTNGATLGIYYTNNSGASISIYSNYTGQSLYVKSGTQLQLHASNSSNDEAYITLKVGTSYAVLGQLTSSMQKYTSVTLEGSSDTVFDSWYRARRLGTFKFTDSSGRSPTLTYSATKTIYYSTNSAQFSSNGTSLSFSSGSTYYLYDFIVGYATSSMSVSQQLNYINTITIKATKTASNTWAYNFTTNGTDISWKYDTTYSFTQFTATGSGSFKYGLTSAKTLTTTLSTNSNTDFVTVSISSLNSFVASTSSAGTYYSNDYFYLSKNSTIYLKDQYSYSSLLKYTKVTLNNTSKTFRNGKGLSFAVGTNSTASASGSLKTVNVQCKCPDAGSGNWTATFKNNSEIGVNIYYNTKKMKDYPDYNYNRGSFYLSSGSTTTKTLNDVAWYEDNLIGAKIYNYSLDTGTVYVNSVSSGADFLPLHNASSSYWTLD